MHPFISRTITAATLAASAFAASAATVTLSDWTYGNGNLVNAVAYVGATPVGYTGATAYAGGFNASLSGSAGFDTPSFATYCIEIEETFAFSATPVADYTVVKGSDYFLNRRNDAGIADRLGRLMTYVFDNPTVVDTAAESTSLQLAIWNTVYDTDNTVTTVSAFRDKSAYKTQADVLLAGALTVSNSRFDVYALEKSGVQDLLLLEPAGFNSRLLQDPASVPEPASLALCAAALAGLAAARHRAGSRSAAAR